MAMFILRTTHSLQYIVRLSPLPQIFKNCLLVHFFNEATIHLLVVRHLRE